MAENSFQSGGQILVLAPDEHLASEITSALGEAAPAAQVQLATNLGQAQELVRHEKPDLFVLDVDATYDLGQEFLFDLRTSHPNARAIILTAIHLAAHREQAAGLGAIHFLEKPFPRADFVDLVQALLQPSSKPESQKFQGTLSDLHIADIIQLKCMSGATTALEFTGPRGEKARVFFENGQVRHATAPDKVGISAFNEIVDWRGGMISEVSGVTDIPRTIELDWQILLMEAVRSLDETRATPSPARSGAGKGSAGKVLVIDDSAMLLNFVEEILSESNFQAVTAPTGEEGLRLSESEAPDLILLDYVLPDLKGDEVCRRLLENPTTGKIPVVFMSGFGADLRPEQVTNSNVVGFLSKPFTSETLTKMVTRNVPQAAVAESATASEQSPEVEQLVSLDEAVKNEQGNVVPEYVAAETDEPTGWEPAESVRESAPAAAFETASPPTEAAWPQSDSGNGASSPEISLPESGTFFSGDSTFFSLHWALQTIAREKLTGTLRAFWKKEPVELLAQNGKIVLVTSRDPDLYCPEAPVTLVNVDADKIANARERQLETGCPVFLTLARDGLIIREPALQLVQHYGQKLFAQLWTSRRVRFVFELSAELPEFARDVPGDADVDQWSLTTLRFTQYQELEEVDPIDPACIPAYTRDGFLRVQKLRLTVAEAQFASQFNGSRSVMQIAKNLRLDLKFARLTLFRFLGLEIVECWPASTAPKQVKRGLFQRLSDSVGFGD
jgi:DNA-binding response OmpR family regulator